MSNSVLSQPKFDLYQTVTAEIVAAIQRGAGSCTMPWHGGASVGLPINAATEAYYKGINVLTLWVSALRNSYASGTWASYRQWHDLGAQVRKGEQGSIIVFYREIPNAENGERPRFVARASRVFNAAQVLGWVAPSPAPVSPVRINDRIEAFVRASGATVRIGAQMACYRSKGDRIELPSPDMFTGSATRTATEAYYGVLLHELVHWTGAEHRLSRTFGERFGDRAYAFEELIAELGSAFLCSTFGVANEPRPDHAAYINSWLQILDKDHRAIFTAASQAQKAIEYLRALAESHPQEA